MSWYWEAERRFSPEQRRRMARSGVARPDGSYPIPDRDALRRAIASIGRANPGDRAAVRRHIVKRARALGAVAMLPDDWNVTEATRHGPRGDLMHLRETTAAALSEAAVNENGRVLLRLIAPGWSQNGRYYSESLLRSDGLRAFRAGVHTYADHPSLSERTDRPERSVRDLVGALVENSYYDPNGPAGPGLYARANVRDEYRPLVDDLAPVIGMSIRADGTGHHGEADGRQGTIIDTIESADSVDYVTSPAAGGRVIQLLESVQNPDRETEPLDEARNAADWIEVEIHRGVLGLANSMWERGQLTREEWQAVASATGEAMDRFRSSLVAARPDLLTRDPLVQADGGQVGMSEAGTEPTTAAERTGAPPAPPAEADPSGTPPAEPTPESAPPPAEPAPTENSPADPAGATADPSAPIEESTSTSEEGDMTGTPGAGTAPLSTSRQLIEAEVAQLRQRAALAEAREHARHVLHRAYADAQVPPATVHRITESLLTRLPLTETRQLNEPELLRLAQAELNQAETEMFEALSAAGVGRPRDLGYSQDGASAPYGPAAEQFDDRLTSAFADLGLSESAVKIAVKGRD